jgi:hypothetical protein
MVNENSTRFLQYCLQWASLGMSCLLSIPASSGANDARIVLSYYFSVGFRFSPGLPGYTAPAKTFAASRTPPISIPTMISTSILLTFGPAASLATALLYYDYVLTFPYEVKYIWGRRISPTTFLYWGCRYAMLANLLYLLQLSRLVPQ